MISVLMSLYKKENPVWFRAAFESITFKQERMPDEVVLVCDGPLTPELDEVIENLNRKFTGGDMAVSDHAGRFPVAARNFLNIVKLPQNAGLGLALAAGLEACTGDLIARMDTDDIAIPERLKIQEEFMAGHPEISACGGDIAEFEREGETIREKHMPHSPEALYSYGKQRNPLNHMTVMFRKADIIEVGSYQHFPLLEDYHLWSRLLASGKKITNIDSVLVNARINSSFADKRGGKEYFSWYKQLRRLQREWGYLNYPEYIISLALTFIMTRQSSVARDKAYRLLRDQK